MKRVFAVFLAFSSCACSMDSDTGRIGSLALDLVRGSSTRVTREQAAAVPYASMGMAVGSGPQGLLVLGMLTPDQAEWYAGEHIFVATAPNGQILRTIGLPYDLGGLRLDMTPADQNTQGEASSLARRITFDFPDLGIYNAGAQCTARDLGDESVDILGASLSTRHVVQHCEVPVLKWRFDNDFWRDPDTGLVWRTSQHIHPKSPAVTLEVLRPVQQAMQ